MKIIKIVLGELIDSTVEVLACYAGVLAGFMLWAATLDYARHS